MTALRPSTNEPLTELKNSHLFNFKTYKDHFTNSLTKAEHILRKGRLVTWCTLIEGLFSTVQHLLFLLLLFLLLVTWFYYYIWSLVYVLFHCCLNCMYFIATADDWHFQYHLSNWVVICAVGIIMLHTDSSLASNEAGIYAFLLLSFLLLIDVHRFKIFIKNRRTTSSSSNTKLDLTQPILTQHNCYSCVDLRSKK